MSKITFHHNDHGLTVCQYIDNDGRHYQGAAQCHPQDEDFYTKLGGEIIASKRTLDKVYRAELKSLKRELRVLNNLLTTFGVGKKYEAEIGSNMFKQVRRARNLKQAEVHAMIQCIAQNRADLADYLNEKEHFYQEMRKIRSRQMENPGQN